MIRLHGNMEFSDHPDMHKADPVSCSCPYMPQLALRILINIFVNMLIETVF